MKSQLEAERNELQSFQSQLEESANKNQVLVDTIDRLKSHLENQKGDSEELTQSYLHQIETLQQDVELYKSKVSVRIAIVEMT